MSLLRLKHRMAPFIRNSVHSELDVSYVDTFVDVSDETGKSLGKRTVRVRSVKKIPEDFNPNAGLLASDFSIENLWKAGVQIPQVDPVFLHSEAFQASQFSSAVEDMDYSQFEDKNN